MHQFYLFFVLCLLVVLGEFTAQSLVL